MSAKTVLVIDYEPGSVKGTTAALQRAGYRVESVRDGVAGLQAFAKLKPDLVLVEAMLPKKHGFEVCQAIKNSPDGDRTSVVITTAIYKGRKYRADAFGTYKCDEYLEKPFTDEQLLTTCRRLLHEDAAVATVSGGATRVEGSTSPPTTAPGSPARHLTEPPDVLRDLTEDEIDGRLDALLSERGASAAPPGLDLPIRNDSPASPGASEAAPRARLLDVNVPETDPLSWEALTNAPSTFDIPDGDWVTGPAVEPPKADPVSLPVARPATKPPKNRVSPQNPPPPKATPVAKAVAQAAAIEPVPAPAPRRAEHAAFTKPAARSIPRSILATAGLAVAAAIAAAVWLRSGNDAPPAGPPPAARPDVAAVSAPPDMPVPAAPVAAADSGNTAADAAIVEVPPPAPVRPPTPPAAKTKAPIRESAASAASPPTVSRSAIAPAPTVSIAKPPAAIPDPAPTNPEPAVDESIDDGVSRPGAAPLAPAPAETLAEEQAPAVARGDLLLLSSVDTPPVEVSRRSPTYPPFALQMRQQGTVTVWALIDETGAVAETQILEGIPGSQLNDSALQAVRGWTYRPAMKGGVPVKVWMTVAVTFRL